MGPIIASLSLGSAAEMHFRLHSKYVDAEAPRKIALSLLLKHVCSSNPQIEPYLADSPGRCLGHGRSQCARVLRVSPPKLDSTLLNHRDRHAVVPKNFRIVATARFISPENYTTLGRN